MLPPGHSSVPPSKVQPLVQKPPGDEVSQKWAASHSVVTVQGLPTEVALLQAAQERKAKATRARFMGAAHSTKDPEG